MKEMGWPGVRLWTVGLVSGTTAGIIFEHHDDDDDEDDDNDENDDNDDDDDDDNDDDEAAHNAYSRRVSRAKQECFTNDSPIVLTFSYCVTPHP